MASMDRAGADGSPQHGRGNGHDEGLTVVTVGGYRIPKLKVKQLIQLCREIDAKRRAALVQVLEDAGASAETRLEELKNLERYGNETVELARYALTMEGACDIIERALSQMKDAPSLDELEIERVGLLRLSCALINFDFDQLTAPSEPEADPTLSRSQSVATG